MSASRPTGDSLKLAKKLQLLAHRAAEETLHKEGHGGLQAAGALMEKVIAETASGKGAAKNAKRDEEEREAWEKSCAVWRKAGTVYDAYTAKLNAYTDSGMRLPFRPPPPHPGPGPGPFVSSAERNRLQNEARAAANRAKMASMPSSSNSSCSPMPTIVHGVKAGKEILEHQRERELAKIDKVAERAHENRRYKLARLGEKLLAWARSIRSYPSLTGTANRLQLAAYQLSNDKELSITQRRKWSNILKFCVQCRSGKVELSLLGRAISTAARSGVVSDTIHISNLPGPFTNTEMVRSVLPQLKGLITKSPVYRAARSVPGGHIKRNKVAMRDGWSCGYAIFQLDSCELASDIVHYLQDEANRITAECSDLTTNKKTGKVTIKPAGKRTTTVVIQLATTTTQRTKQEQREYEEAVIAERKRIHNENVARERKAILAQKWAEKQWTDSFVALPGQSAAVAKVSTGPSFKDLLAGLASKPAPVLVAPAECPVGWHEGQIYDVVSVQDQLARFNGCVEPEPEPMVTVIENGWEVEYTREQVEAGAAAEAAAAAAIPVKAAKPVMLALPGKAGIYSSFFAVARAMKASLKAEAAHKSVVSDMSWANSASASA